MSTEENAPDATVSTEAPKRSLMDRLFDRPYAICLLAFLFFQVFLIPFAIPAYILDRLPAFEELHFFENTLPILAAIIMAAWFGHRYKGRFDGVHGWSTEGMLLVLPALAYVAYTFANALLNKSVPNPLLQALLAGIAPGVTEELVFRSIPISNWMRVDGNESGIIPCTLTTALVFGLVHCANGLMGAPASTAVFQSFYATCLGILFAAVFLRTGSILPTIIMHALIDVASMLFMDLSANGIITEELTIGPEFFIVIVISLACAAFGLYLLRPEKRTEIVKLWNRKWHRAA